MRAGVSAIEAGRLAPSVTAALALSKALGCTVEDLFAEPMHSSPAGEWAVPPAVPQPRYWKARVGGRLLLYPVGDDSRSLEWHDGVFREGGHAAAESTIADRTLVVAGCDPAAGLLAMEYARQFQFRMIVLRRSSRAALDLLAEGRVHAAGIHLGHGGKSRNLTAARSRVGRACRLVRVARWEEGVAIGQRFKASTIQNLVRSKAHWIGREEGSGIRQCQDEILAGKPAPRRVAFDHRSVAAAVKCGWADVGPCVRLATEESGLRFLRLNEKDYDICLSSDPSSDRRLAALLATLRSRNYRSRLSELPGYSTRQTGELVE